MQQTATKAWSTAAQLQRIGALLRAGLVRFRGIVGDLRAQDPYRFSGVPVAGQRRMSMAAPARRRSLSVVPRSTFATLRNVCCAASADIGRTGPEQGHRTDTLNIWAHHLG